MSEKMDFDEMVQDLKVSAYLACKNILEDDKTPPKEKRETAALVFEVSGDIAPKRVGPSNGKSNYTQINFSENFSPDQVDGLKSLFGAVHEERSREPVPTEPLEEGNQ